MKVFGLFVFKVEWENLNDDYLNTLKLELSHQNGHQLGKGLQNYTNNNSKSLVIIKKYTALMITIIN